MLKALAIANTRWKPNDLIPGFFNQLIFTFFNNPYTLYRMCIKFHYIWLNNQIVIKHLKFRASKFGGNIRLILLINIKFHSYKCSEVYAYKISFWSAELRTNGRTDSTYKALPICNSYSCNNRCWNGLNVSLVIHIFPVPRLYWRLTGLLITKTAFSFHMTKQRIRLPLTS